MDDLGESTSTTKLRTSVVKKICVIVALVIASALIVYLATSNHPSNTTVGNPYEISLIQINKNTQSGSLLIDVRTPEEYAAQHAKGAINMPLADLQKGKTPPVVKDVIVYVYCHSGARAAQAKTLLEKNGYQHVISLGSLEQWLSLGGQVIEPSKCDGSNLSKC